MKLKAHDLEPTRSGPNLFQAEADNTLAFEDRPGAERILSSIGKSDSLNFGVILDSQKRVFASYFKPNAAAKKQTVLGGVLPLLVNRPTEIVTNTQLFALALVPVHRGGRDTGYVKVGTTRP